MKCFTCGHKKEAHGPNSVSDRKPFKDFCAMCVGDLSLDKINGIAYCWHDFKNNLDYLEDLYEAKDK